MSELVSLQATSGANQIGLWRPSFTRHRHLLYIFGGGGMVTSSIHVLNLLTRTWSTLLDVRGMPPSRRYGHTASLYQNKIIVFGGSNEVQEFCSDVVVYDMTEKCWSRPTLSGPEIHPRYLHTATVFADKLYVYGGFAKNSECTFVLNQISILDLRTWTWSDPVTVPARYNHSATRVGDRLYVYAGKNESGQTVPDLFMVDLNTLKVMPLPGVDGEVALLKSQHFTESLSGNRLVMFGKFAAGGLKDVEKTEASLHPNNTVQAPLEENSCGLWMLELDTLEWRQLPWDGMIKSTLAAYRPDDRENWSSGVWNFFTTVPYSELYSIDSIQGDHQMQTSIHDSSRQRRLFVFLGNIDKERTQPYDHFQELLVVDPEALNVWQVPSHPLHEDLSEMLLNHEALEFADFILESVPEEDDMDQGMSFIRFCDYHSCSRGNSLSSRYFMGEMAIFPQFGIFWNARNSTRTPTYGSKTTSG